MKRCYDCKFFTKHDGCIKSINGRYIAPKKGFDWVVSTLEFNKSNNCICYKRKWYLFWK